MRFWRRSTSEPIPGPDPGAEALREDTIDRQPEDGQSAELSKPAPMSGLWGGSPREPPEEAVDGPQAAAAPESAEGVERRGWLGRLRAGMARSS
ncbi:MAG: hypothetical protein ACJ8AH_24295, partial [Stellaceae bacterium]